MAVQQYAVNNMRRRPYQVDQMNARRALLPNIIANQKHFQTNMNKKILALSSCNESKY